MYLHDGLFLFIFCQMYLIHFYFVLLLLKSYLFMKVRLKLKVWERQIETEVFHILIHFPDSWKGPGLGQADPRNLKIHPGFQCAWQEFQYVCHVPLSFPGPKQRARSEVGHPGQTPAPYVIFCCVEADSSFTHFTKIHQVYFWTVPFVCSTLLENQPLIVQMFFLRTKFE